MTHCAKCGAELIGSRKFCAACGAPAGDPRSPAASTGLAPVMSGRVPGAPGSAPGSSPNPGSNPGSGPSIQYAPAPASQVNPFAQTAGPVTNRQKAPDYGPPPPPSIPPELGSTTPGVGDPLAAPQVSPLAVSNVSSQRGAFENAITSGPASTAAVAAGLVGVITHPDHDASQSGVKQSAVAGTQMMPSGANPAAIASAAASSATPSGGAAAASKRQDRTQLLGAFPPGIVPRPGAPAPAPAPAHAPAAAPAQAPAGAPSAGAMPVADPQRISSVPNIPAAAHAPPMPVVQAPQPTQPMQPAPGAWSPAAAAYGNPQAPQPPQPMQPQPQPIPYGAPAPGYGFGFAYVPGSRVQVTWSNGGRYPGTVQQVSGTQCLVVFPDGQQHWVEMQYVAPA
ncbi:MAG: hypothetical protein JWO86_4975 [Myxococcaceae bacterium]|nr:hypothetical protein [Myxococcaceae bacterium]